MVEKVEMKIKIALLGDGTVGKTSLIRRFVYDEFGDRYLKTFGTKTTKRVMEITDPRDGALVEMALLIVDIMGQTELVGLHDRYLFGVKGAIIVCDVTSRPSMEHMEGWVAKVTKVCPDASLVFVANKLDLAHKAAFKIEEMLAIAEKYQSPCYLSSAKTGENVELMFQTLSTALLKLRTE